MSFKTLWCLAFACILAGAVFQLTMQPELRDGAMTFTPDLSRAGELLQAPGRVLGHSPALFLVNAGLLAGVFALVFVRSAEK